MNSLIKVYTKIVSAYTIQFNSTQFKYFIHHLWEISINSKRCYRKNSVHTTSILIANCAYSKVLLSQSPLNMMCGSKIMNENLVKIQDKSWNMKTSCICNVCLHSSKDRQIKYLSIYDTTLLYCTLLDSAFSDFFGI